MPGRRETALRTKAEVTVETGVIRCPLLTIEHCGNPPDLQSRGILSALLHTLLLSSTTQTGWTRWRHTRSLTGTTPPPHSATQADPDTVTVRTHKLNAQIQGPKWPKRLTIHGTQEETFSMDDLAELHDKALEATGRIVSRVRANQWQELTPCADWNVRELVNHVVSGNLWAAELGAGATIADVGERLDGDVLGDDPAGAYDESARAASAVFHRPGAMDAPCAVSYGPVPGSVYAGHRFLDVLVHGWDIAVATDQDRTLNESLVQGCLEVVEPQAELLRASGMFHDDVTAPRGAGPQTRLLALLGRDG